MNKLTDPQRSVLKKLTEPNYISGRSCTNPTLNALRRRGLVELHWKPNQYNAAWSPTEDWRITEAGRAAIALRP